MNANTIRYTQFVENAILNDAILQEMNSALEAIYANGIPISYMVESGTSVPTPMYDLITKTRIDSLKQAIHDRITSLKSECERFALKNPLNFI
jgi:hypothetical protein